MADFIKQVSGIYDLIHDYSSVLQPGEIIKTYTVTLDGSGIVKPISSGLFIADFSKYSKDKVITKVQLGEHGSGYVVQSSVVTNKNNSYSRNVAVDVDEDTYPYAYDSFYYSFQTSTEDESIFIVPDLNTSSFTNNTQFQITIDPGMSGIINSQMTDPYGFWFTTQYCPLFATATTIKLMGGPDIEGFSDDTINRMIHKNSLDAVDMVNHSTNNSYSYTAWGCTPENVPYQLKRYTECKTAYDLLAISEAYNNTGKSQSKTLGDMGINYGSAPGGQSSGNPKKKDFYDCYMNTIKIIGNGLSSAVRGLYDLSRGYGHPVYDETYPRLTRDVDVARSDPAGPYSSSTGWLYTNKARRTL